MKIPVVSKNGKKFKRTATKAQIKAFERQKLIVFLHDKSKVPFKCIAIELGLTQPRISQLYILGKRKYLQ